MQTENVDQGIGVDSETLKNHFVAYIRKADELQRSIQKTQDEIKCLISFVDSKIQDLVYDCYEVDELAALCKSFGLDNTGYQWGWKKAYENTNCRDTNHELTEWHNVQSSVTTELQIHIRKLARETQ